MQFISPEMVLQFTLLGAYSALPLPQKISSPRDINQAWNNKV